jgi:hypothetical protein
MVRRPRKDQDPLLLMHKKHGVNLLKRSRLLGSPVRKVAGLPFLCLRQE